MHPAPSVILFTTLSGLGFGLLVFLGLGTPYVTGLEAFAYFTLAYLLAVGGLLSATAHLQNPKNAWKAFRQWRSSWLSREGIAAVATLLVMALYGAGLVFFDTRLPALGFIGAVFSLVTVFTTAMIYAQIKAIPRWHQWGTVAYFISLMLTGGAILSGEITFAKMLLALSAGFQVWHWWKGDQRFSETGSTMNSATGLQGKVRLFEAPHSGKNYLLNEMVYVVAQKHSHKLRHFALIFGFLLPLVFLMIPVTWVAIVCATLSHGLGIAISRWLFFAQAEHVVGLYYGARG